jgi:hypothetical protein
MKHWTHQAMWCHVLYTKPCITWCAWCINPSKQCIREMAVWKQIVMWRQWLVGIHHVWRAGDSSILVCRTVSVAWVLALERHCYHFKYWKPPNDAASHPRWLESSATPCKNLSSYEVKIVIPGTCCCIIHLSRIFIWDQLFVLFSCIEMWHLFVAGWSYHSYTSGNIISQRTKLEEESIYPFIFSYERNVRIQRYYL